MKKTSCSRTENDMQNTIKAFREGRNCHAAELFLEFLIHPCRFLRTDQDKPLKNKGSRTMFTLEHGRAKVAHCVTGR